MPWPGVRAWPAPSAAAVSTEMSRITGVRSAVRKIDGRSPAVTPPGTDPGPADAPGLAPGGLAAAPALVLGSGLPPGAAGSSGLASGISNAASVGPPGETVNVALVSSSACARRFVGYAVRRADRLVGSDLGVPAVDRHLGAFDDDLAPAKSFPERGVRVAEPTAGGEWRVKRGNEPAHDPHRGQSARAGWEGQAGFGQGQVLADVVDGQVERRLQLLARGDPAGFGFAVGHVAVAVRVEVEPCLERRDLRLVDDDVEQDPVRLDPDPGVVVDREVAQRVGEGQRREQERGDDPERRSNEPATSPARSTHCRSASLACASVAW